MVLSVCQWDGVSNDRTLAVDLLKGDHADSVDAVQHVLGTTV
jgi:hypothetical protein